VIVSVCSLKGGAGKTTSAVYLAAAAQNLRGSVTLLDADPEGSALSWAKYAAFPFPVQAAPVITLAAAISAAASETQHVVVDTPPNDRAALATAAHAADVVVVPVRPTGVDVDRIQPTLEALLDVERARGQLDAAVLFTMWDARRVLAREAQDALGHLPVLDARIRSLARYEEAFGTDPTYLDEYLSVWKELESGT